VSVDGRLRIVVGEDDLLVREGLHQVLQEENGEFDVVALCGDYDSVLEAVEREQPDVVITDIRMPPTKTDEGIRVAARLREIAPEVGVVVLSNYAGPNYALQLLERGSTGRAYLLKERIAHRIQLFGAIREVAAGGSIIDPQVVETLVAAKTRAADAQLQNLTSRELEVLAAMAEGKSNGGIAESLHLTKRGVEKHVNSIFAKLDLPEERAVSRRVLAALLYLAERAPQAVD
jgi:DNA-binding NarL/FixJ family response regulator